MRRVEFVGPSACIVLPRFRVDTAHLPATCVRVVLGLQESHTILVPLKARNFKRIDSYMHERIHALPLSHIDT